MKCPLCAHPDTRVLRTKDEDTGIKRSRRCERCGYRWPTIEINLDRAVKLEKLATAARETLAGG